MLNNTVKGNIYHKLIQMSLTRIECKSSTSEQSQIQFGLAPY